MRIAEMLNAMAKWLESPTNEALLLAEDNEECMKVVAESCVLAAALLKKAADEVEFLEPAEPSKITPNAIEEIASLAAAFDSSGDPELKKQASVLDELLLSISAPPGAIKAAAEKEDARIEELRKKYQKPREELHTMDKTSDSMKAIDKSNMTKRYRIMEAPLSSRYCPDHPGAQISRVGEHVWQCELDKKIYNFETGFEKENGEKVPGGDVANQTQGISTPFHAIFDTREGRLGYNTAASKKEEMVKQASRDEMKLLREITRTKFWRESDKEEKLRLLKELQVLALKDEPEERTPVIELPAVE
jgi:hypothetical protein